MQNKFIASRASTGMSVVIALVVLSFRQYFFYVPFANGVDALGSLGFLAFLGWVSLVLFPPILLSSAENWSKAKSALLVASVLLYPISTTGVKIFTFATYGKVWADYLISYPILLFIEFIVPAIYILVAVSLNRSMSKVRAD